MDFLLHNELATHHPDSFSTSGERSISDGAQKAQSATSIDKSYSSVGTSGTRGFHSLKNKRLALQTESHKTRRSASSAPLLPRGNHRPIYAVDATLTQ
jgi:hypothetical protein